MRCWLLQPVCVERDVMAGGSNGKEVVVWKRVVIGIVDVVGGGIVHK